MARGPLGVLPVEPLWPCPPFPLPPAGSASTSPAHVLGPVLAGLLGGQLSDEQGLQELAHEAEVLVEGVEGILRESRQSAGLADRQTDRPTKGQRPGPQASWRTADGRARQTRPMGGGGWLVRGPRTSRTGVSLVQEPPGPPGPDPCQPGRLLGPPSGLLHTCWVPPPPDSLRVSWTALCFLL